MSEIQTPRSPAENYSAFLDILSNGQITEASVAKITRKLIRSIARNVHPNHSAIDSLKIFFEQALSLVGLDYNKDEIATYYDSLVIDWGKEGKRQRVKFAFAIYYYIHFLKSTSASAETIDCQLLGKTFQSFFKKPVPGGFKKELTLYLSSDSIEPHLKHVMHDVHAEVEHIQSSLAESFVGRQDVFEQVDSFIEARLAGKNRGLLIIAAPAGFGKSAFAAEWIRRNKSEATSVASQFCNNAYKITTDVTKGLEYLNLQIAEAYGEAAENSSVLGQIKTRLAKDVPYGRQLIVWLDGLDEVSADLPSRDYSQRGQKDAAGVA